MRIVIRLLPACRRGPARGVLLSLVAAAIGSLLAPAQGVATPLAFGHTTVFANVPTPGHPFGVLATENAVYVATSAGSPFDPNTRPETIFRYDPEGGRPTASVAVPTMPQMGLHDIAEDGDGRIYVVDMNSRILRFTPTETGLSEPAVYASVPEPYATLGWAASMWQNLAFDSDGNLFVTDASLGAIWRIGPDRIPTIWLRCPKFLSMQIAGLNGIAFGPDHRLYVVQLAVHDPANFGGSRVYRLPRPAPGRAPSCAGAKVFHDFRVNRAQKRVPFPSGCDLAFAKSGNMYVTLNAHNAVAVIGPNGRELRRISDKRFDVPIGIRFQQDSVLIANSNYLPRENADHWLILKAFVGEPGLPLVRPHLPSARRPGRWPVKLGAA